MKKLELTPSRNINYRRGQVAEGDRYVGIRSDEHLELANHLLKTVIFNFNNKKKFFFAYIFLG